MRHAWHSLSFAVRRHHETNTRKRQALQQPGLQPSFNHKLNFRLLHHVKKATAMAAEATSWGVLT
jgi:hypothetical protein